MSSDSSKLFVQIQKSLLLVSKVFLVTAYFVAFFTIFLNHSGVVWRDYISFHTGGYMMSQGQARNLYDIENQKRFQLLSSAPYERSNLLPFRNPPIVALLFEPFGNLPIQISLRLFTILNLLIVVWLYRDSRNIFDKIPSFYSLVFLYFPLAVNIYIGQLSVVILLIVYLIYKSHQREDSLWSGFSSGLLFIKPQLLLFVPFLYLLSKNKKKYLIGFALSALSLIFISCLISGITWFVDYARFIRLTEVKDLGSPLGSMYTLYPTLVFILSNSIYAVIINGFLYLLCLYLFNNNLTKSDRNLYFAAGLIISVLFSVHAYIHDLSLFIIVIMILVNTNYILFKKYIYFLFIVPFFGFGNLENIYSIGFLIIALKLVFIKSTLK